MSIRLRITLWFTVALALALAAAGILVFTLLSRELQADVDSSIVNKAHDAALSIRYVNGQLSVPTTIMVPNSEFRAPTLYTEIRDPDWRDVWRSETLQDSELPILGETESSARQGLPTFENVMLSDQRVRVYTAPILVRDTTRGYVQVGRNLSDIDVALKQLRGWLLISSALVVASAGVGGFLLSRAALRPIDQITRAAHAIGLARRIDQRLPHPARLDEVGRLALTFNQMLDRVEDTFLAQQRFVADASHELRTPLTAIQGNLEFVRRDPAMPAAARDEALGDVTEAASLMGRLVDGLLALARADSGRHLARRPVALRPIVESCTHQAQILARPADIRVDLMLNRLEPGACLDADADKLRDLLMTLLENAIKYNHPEGQVHVSASTEGQIHRIAIADTGRGIAATDLDHIFERFYRSSRTRSEDGSGLGLAIARWVIDELDGQITVESVVDVGTTFVIKLPALAPTPLITAS